MIPLDLSACLLTAPHQQPATKTVDVGGNFTVVADFLPKRDAAELRPRAGIEIEAAPSSHFRMRLEGFVEALAADRGGRVLDAGVRVREAWIEVGGARADVRAGYGRLVWGRLDEIQPSDVINPLDTSRFLFEGRSAARLPVAFVTGRWFLSERLVVEAALVPKFRRAVFDELDEPTSPFNLFNDLVLPASIALTSPNLERRKPTMSWANVSGGGRVRATVGRVDFAAAVYRGFEGFGTLTFEPHFGAQIGPTVVGSLVERFPRFTMISGDFETVRGEWALRGEAAVFMEKKFASSLGGVVDGRAIDAGVGFDRRAGSYRVFGSVLLQSQWSAADAAVEKTNVSVVGSIERQLARDKYLVRAFSIVNASDGSGFIRALGIWHPRDNFALEFSAAAFFGTGDDTLSRFKERDFVLSRVVVLF